MRNPRDPFSEALRAIRSQLRAGRFAQGQRLAITDLARELELSATPVREALCRLAGEGLVEERRGQGYYAWRLDAVDLVELYELQAIYLSSAVARPWVQSSACASERGSDPAARTEQVFAEIVRRGASLALTRANQLLADRLAAPRRVEALVLDGLAAEIDAIAFARQGCELQELLERYHQRRIDQCSAIIAALRSGPVASREYSFDIDEI